MNGEHLSPKTRELLDRPMEERIAHIQKDSWIPYSQAYRILQQLQDLLHHPKCDRIPNLAISAQTNNGKTRLMKHSYRCIRLPRPAAGRSRRRSSMCNAPAFPINDFSIRT
jgi:Bacterial TniB protein